MCIRDRLRVLAGAGNAIAGPVQLGERMRNGPDDDGFRERLVEAFGFQVGVYKRQVCGGDARTRHGSDGVGGIKAGRTPHADSG